MRNLFRRLFLALAKFFGRLAGTDEKPRTEQGQPSEVQEQLPTAKVDPLIPIRLELRLPEFSVETAARELDLEAVGRERGSREQPSTDETELDPIERAILREAERKLDEARGEYERVAAINEIHAEAIALNARIAKVVEMAREAAIGLRTEAREPLNEIFLARERARSEKLHLEDFRRSNNLTHLASYPMSGLGRVCILGFIILVEAIANGSQLASGLPTGLLGGWLMAAVFAALNAGVAFLLGWWSRYISHRHVSLKACGCLLIIVWLIWTAGLNLGIAHFRDALSVDPDNASTIALTQLFAHTLQVANFYSLLLLIIGSVFSVIAFVDGFGFEERYPRYGSLTRQYEQAQRDFAATSASALRTLTNLRERKTRDIRTESDFATVLVARHVENVARARNMLGRLRDYRESVEAAANRLVSIYRNANIHTRTTVPPVHFAVLLHLDQRNVNYDGSIEETSFPLKELSSCSSQIIAAFGEIERSFPALEAL